VTIQKEKPITIPDDILSKYMSDDMIHDFNTSSIGIFSITVYAEKPKNKEEKPKVIVSEIQQNNSSCCSPKSGCC
jgi:hypothetical protein